MDGSTVRSNQRCECYLALFVSEILKQSVGRRYAFLFPIISQLSIYISQLVFYFLCTMFYALGLIHFVCSLSRYHSSMTDSLSIVLSYCPVAPFLNRFSLRMPLAVVQRELVLNSDSSLFSRAWWQSTNGSRLEPFWSVPDRKDPIAFEVQLKSTESRKATERAERRSLKTGRNFVMQPEFGRSATIALRTCGD